MIEHLRGREKELEPLGWSGPEAEWIALVVSAQRHLYPVAILSLL